MEQLQINQVKLSEIFNWASNNVNQCRGRIGNISKNQGCAVGSINMYLSNGKAVSMKELKKIDIFRYKQIKKWKDKNFLKLFLFVLLNDYGFVKFNQMEKIARKFNW